MLADVQVGGVERPDCGGDAPSERADDLAVLIYPTGGVTVLEMRSSVRGLLGACIGVISVSLLAIAYSTSLEASALTDGYRFHAAAIFIAAGVASVIGYRVGSRELGE